jgi:hypothetical protein
MCARKIKVPLITRQLQYTSTKIRSMLFLCFFLLEMYYIKIFFISGIYPLIFSNIMTLKIITQRGIPDLRMPDILIPDPVVSLKSVSKL